jgi:hypothetical protein
MEQTGSDSFHLTHNHPSGLVGPSDADWASTATFLRTLSEMARLRGIPMPKFRGHIIVNHNKFAVINIAPNGDRVHLVRRLDGADTPDPFRDQTAMLPLGQEVKAAEDLARVSQYFQPTGDNVHVAWLNGQSFITEVGAMSRKWLAERIEDGKLEEIQEAVFGYGHSIGSIRALLFADDTIRNRSMAEQLMRAGVFLHGGFASTAKETGKTRFDPAPVDWVNDLEAASTTSFGRNVTSGLTDRTTVSVAEPGQGDASSRSYGSDLLGREDQHDLDDSAEGRLVGGAGRSRTPAPRSPADREAAGSGDRNREGPGGRRAHPAGEGSYGSPADLRSGNGVVREDLFGNPDENDRQLEKERESKAQDSFFMFGNDGSRKGLASTEAASRSEISKLREELPLIESAMKRAKEPAEKAKFAVQRRKVAARIAELEKLVNRDKAIGADEMKTRLMAELRDDLGVSKERLDRYDPEQAVSKLGRTWSYDTIEGNRTPSGYETKREAIQAATAHREMKQKQFDNPQDYRDIVSVRARKSLALIKRLMDQGMSEMEAGRKAREEYPDLSGEEQGSLMERVKAYHGTPHQFDRFSMERIGSGEGSQAFGYGLYFAGKREVANWYREKLAPAISARLDGSKPMGVRDIIKDPSLTPDEQHVLQAAYHDNDIKNGQVREAMERLAKWYEGLGSFTGDHVYANRMQAAAKSLASRLENTQAGALYEVDLPDEDSYLLWDKPLNEQPAVVKKAIHGISDFVWDWASDRLESQGSNAIDADSDIYTGAELYRLLKQWVKEEGPIGREDYDGGRSDAHVSRFLGTVGVNGIKYLDGSSRNTTPVNLKRYEAKVARLQEQFANDPTEVNRGPSRRCATGVAVDAAGRRRAEAGIQLRPLPRRRHQHPVRLRKEKALRLQAREPHGRTFSVDVRAPQPLMEQPRRS